MIIITQTQCAYLSWKRAIILFLHLAISLMLRISTPPALPPWKASTYRLLSGAAVLHLHTGRIAGERPPLASFPGPGSSESARWHLGHMVLQPLFHPQEQNGGDTELQLWAECVWTQSVWKGWMILTLSFAAGESRGVTRSRSFPWHLSGDSSDFLQYTDIHNSRQCAFPSIQSQITIYHIGSKDSRYLMRSIEKWEKMWISESESENFWRGPPCHSLQHRFITPLWEKKGVPRFVIPNSSASEWNNIQVHCVFWFDPSHFVP